MPDLYSNLVTATTEPFQINNSRLFVFIRGSRVRFPNLFFDKPLHVLFFWQFKLVLGNKEPVVHAGQCILHQREVSLGAQKDADGRVISLRHHIHLVPAHIGIELANIFMAEFIEFQFYQHVALENTVIEHKVHEVVCIPDEDAFLPSFKAKPVAKLQQEFLQFIKELIFQVGLAHDFPWLQPEEFEDVWIAYRQFGIGGFGTFLRQFRQFFLVLGKARSFVVEAVDLPFQFPNRPIATNAFYFVEYDY